MSHSESKVDGRWKLSVFSWLHLAAITLLLFSLFSGLRIAVLSFPFLGFLSPILPQGQVHTLHFVSGSLLSAIAVCSLAYYFFCREKQRPLRGRLARYHRAVLWIGCLGLLLSLATGGVLFFAILEAAVLVRVHFFLALAGLGFIFLHGVFYLVQYGVAAMRRILPRAQFSGLPVIKSAAVVGLCLVLLVLAYGSTSSRLDVKSIPIEDIVNVDGEADEAVWQGAIPVTVDTFFGANFEDGGSQVQIKALQNGSDVYMHIRWQDPTESRLHLPLEKTAEGWKVVYEGFENFNETKYYEDKFALLLSNSCSLGGAGTSHLGPKPLGDKPANFHGKGYHYSSDESIHDLWHWKAVRTNEMRLADDNHIGPPYAERPGSRRYTAGYMQDGKESGSYVMNWRWFKTAGVVPKRLPQQAPQTMPAASTQMLGTWFDLSVYNETADTLPVGSVIPSVLYRSNRFEGDRADVRAAGIWRDGYWSLELARTLDTGSPLDVAIRDGVCLWVAAFDHAQVGHTRHSRPIKLKLEES
ncbi:ethylbenzene dehydrogenase-related protein [Microbulbifer aggregans]|uniref:ethylbenzene dehydrogenase-related protein n=1 Tax=Microbulbifer aggregans TaxID=1769779 RepID=UPI001CFDF2A3|nr:ethylbenzene dehydrogenase-related protein [Microbulbifer aggregans]